MQRLNVLVTAEVLANTFTGVEHYTVELVRALARRDDLQVSVLCGKAEHANVFDPDVQREVHPPAAGLGMVGHWLRPPACLGKYDIIHCPTVRTPFLKRPRGPKLVMTVHDLVPLVMPDHHKTAYRIYFRHVLPRILRSCDAIVADSESTRRDIERQYRSALPEVRVVPCGPRWPIPEQLSRERKEHFFLAVGTLEPRKNLLRVIQAFLAFKKEHTECKHRLVLVGKIGWGVGDVQSLIDAHSDVIDRLGYVSEETLQGLYTQATALVYPSLYEGFGLPILEAMSLGCPVITSERASLPEVAGDVALYADPESVADIANAMGRIALDPNLADDLAQRGHIRAQLFSWDRTAAEVAAVYRHVMEQSVAPVPVGAAT